MEGVDKQLYEDIGYIKGKVASINDEVKNQNKKLDDHVKSQDEKYTVLENRVDKHDVMFGKAFVIVGIVIFAITQLFDKGWDWAKHNLGF